MKENTVYEIDLRDLDVKKLEEVLEKLKKDTKRKGASSTRYRA